VREKTLNSQSVSPDTQEHDSQNAEKQSDEAVRHERKGQENPITHDSIGNKKATSNPTLEKLIRHGFHFNP
jgi:hypothetical protein